IGGHNVKTGFRWVRQMGNRSNPQNPSIRYQSKADLLANRPNVVVPTFGAPPHESHLDEFGLFVQDDWRVNKRLVLNLGLRYDYYPSFRYKATGNEEAVINNLGNPTDLRKMDFGPPRDPHDVFDPDRLNFGPRAGFAWTLDGAATTVVRGGVAVLSTGHLNALFQNAVARPYSPVRQGWNATEIAARNVKWPQYPEDHEQIVI